MSEATYEAVKLHSEDKARAEKISAEIGLPIVHTIGVALEALAALPKKTQERLVRERRERVIQSDRRRPAVA